MSAITDLDLTKRAEVTAALTATQHDNNLAAIEAKIAEILDVLNLVDENIETYGEMYQAGNTTATTLATNGTFKDVVNFSSGHVDNVTFGTSTLAPATAGDYTVTFQASFTGGTSDIIQFGVGVGGAHDATHLVEQKLQNTDVQSVSLTCIVTLTAGQLVSLMINRSSGAAANVTVKHATLVLRKVH